MNEVYDKNEGAQCPRCNSTVPKQTLGGLCPRCLMEQAFARTEAETFAAGADPLPPAELAEHFPQLEILECLGRGGMGVVYKARQRSLNRLVALKLLAPERASDPDFAIRFEKEAQALAALNHPHIVAIHDFGVAGGFYYLLMEFVDGANLRQLLQSKRFTPEEALAVIPPICDALQCAHERGIVHRDIKPENLLLDRNGIVKIADFGIAKIIEGSPASSPGSGASDGRDIGTTPQTQTEGTPQYAAPEQQDLRAKQDHRADIYSLGVVLYELLTGERPTGTLERPSRILRVDIRVDEIVLKALEKDPELRFATAAEFRDQVLEVASSFPRAAQSAGSSEQEKSREKETETGRSPEEAGSSASPVRRRRSLLLAGFVIILLAMVLWNNAEKLHLAEPTRTVSGTVVTPDGKPVVAGNVGIRRNGNNPGRVMALDLGKFAFRSMRPGGDYLVEFEVPGHSVKTRWPSVGDQDVSFTSIAYPLQKYRIRVEAPDDTRELWVTAGIGSRDQGVRFGDHTGFWFIQEGEVLALDIPPDGKYQMRLNHKMEGRGSPRFRGALNKGDTVELLDENGGVLHRIQCLEVANH